MPHKGICRERWIEQDGLGMKTVRSTESMGVEAPRDGPQHASDIVSLGGSGMMGLLVYGSGTHE
jgi:hypothetical protein